MKVIHVDNNKINSTSSPIENSWAKKIVLQWLGQLSHGRLTLEDCGKHYHFGESAQVAEIVAHITIYDDSVYHDLLFKGTIGSGEAYMKGNWDSPNLVNVIRLMCRNMDSLQKINGCWSSISQFVASLFHRLRANNRKNSRLNIAAHYDLGNDFFSLFLDKTMMYSSALYPSISSTLDEAAIYKLEHICQRLNLNENDHLLEIGTGWGGMAIYAAKHYGCRVTTTTISQEQHAYAETAVRQAGLQDKITLLLDDYRDLNGKFDKLVSIEMIEAVGRKYYRQYFSTCSHLLKEEGLMLIQAITMPDQYYRRKGKKADFIQHYIFPGGDLPSLTVMSDHIGRYTDMQIAGVEDITLDYAATLADWKKRFLSELSTVKALGYDDHFIHMWDFYLSYCEGGFRERTINTHQLLMAKPSCSTIPSVYHGCREE